MARISYTKLFSRTKNHHTSTSSSSSSQNRKHYVARFWPWISLSFGVLWLVPAVFILAVNFKNVLVGPSIGCLQSNKKCHLDLHSTTQIQQAKAFEKNDQQALAGLQLAAKALDAWFCFIAAGLVWSILKRLAGQDSTDSLPVGYLHIHTECSDLRVLPKLFWGRRRDANRREGWSRTRLYFFITFVTCICVLCNLMGPATAVLIIPNLEWIDINKSPNTWFHSVLSPSRPLNASIARSCTEDFLINGTYSCTFKSYLATTDMVVAAAIATDDQSFNAGKEIPFKALLLPPILQEGNVSFTVNFSDFTAWIPNRQSLQNLSADLQNYDKMTGNASRPEQNYPDSALFNRSLQTRLLQRGPVLGQNNQCFIANNISLENFNITDDHTVRCYQQFLPNNVSVWKCVPMGTEWTQFSTRASSLIIEDFYRTITTPAADSSGQTSNGDITVTIHAASASLDIDDSTFQDAVVGHDFDWITAFSNSQLPPKTNFTGPRQIFEYRRNIPLMGTKGEIVPNFVYCDSQTELGVADYALNPSLLSNPIRLVETNVITDPNPDTPVPQPIYIHPDWTLAAWSVDLKGVGNTVGGKRGAARKIVVALEDWLAAEHSPANGENIQDAQDFRNIHKFMGAQTVSLIPYTFIWAQPKDLFLQPALNGKAMVQLWKYDLNSPSSIFGLVIVLFGIICVVARTVMYTIDREEMKDATELLVTALKQVPKQSSHSRNASSTPSLQPPATPPGMALMSVDVDDDDEDDKKEFPIVCVSPVTPPNLSGGPSNLSGTLKRIPYKRRISFHG